MTEVGALLFLYWGITGVLTLIFVPDFFSPDKFILASLGFFFGDIFFSQYDNWVVLIYFSLLTFLWWGVWISYKFRIGSYPGYRFRPNRISVDYRLFWILSIPPIIANVYMIYSFGGIVGYINSIAMREMEFKGMGILLVFLKMFPVINLVYFCHFINQQDKSFKTKFYYIVHFTIFLILALITTSRGSLLNNLVMMMIIYHYTVKMVSKKIILYLGIFLLGVASVLEVAREGITFSEGQLKTGLSYEDNDRKLSANWARYGTEPLEIVLSAEEISKRYGATYLTLITNFIPRSIWAAKPDPGGVVLTKEYMDDAWGGSSYLSTGIIPEAIINFGKISGTIFGLSQFFLMILWIMVVYHNYRIKPILGSRNFIFASVRYVYIMWATMALIVGEFTNIMMDLIIKLVFVWLIEAIAVRTGAVKILERKI